MFISFLAEIFTVEAWHFDRVLYSCQFRQNLAHYTIKRHPHFTASYFSNKSSFSLDLLCATHPDSVLSCYPLPGLSDHDAVLV